MPVYLEYYFWLIAASLFCFVLERIHPWREKQRVLRKGFWQDVFWLVFNGQYLGLMMAIVTGKLVLLLNSWLLNVGLPVPQDMRLLSGAPLWIQFSWGPLRYIFNSSAMHVWHHDVEQHGKGGQNFGQVLSIWDWIFGTVYWPRDKKQPSRLGFDGMDRYPQGLLKRLIYPFWRK